MESAAKIVFVNNFAVRTTVDYQLKERFANLRDGAWIVSLKSICLLNFPLTTKLERYFHRLKNNKQGGLDENSDSVISNTANNSSKISNRGERSDRDRYPEMSKNLGSSSNSKQQKINSNFEKENKTEKNNTESSSQSKTKIRKKQEKKSENAVKVKPPIKGRSIGKKVKKNKRKKVINVPGLDLLHDKTLSSISLKTPEKKPPPPPGCVDHQLYFLSPSLQSHSTFVHEELCIPPAPSATLPSSQIVSDLHSFLADK
ncbi:hypothetical protein M0804_009544 [Polistes exclamans]|nr:hypothetical protein M0804_009544 [Polistes exclamans]